MFRKGQKGVTPESFLVTQIHLMLWKLKVPCSVHKNQPLDRIVSHLSPDDFSHPICYSVHLITSAPRAVSSLLDFLSKFCIPFQAWTGP